MAQRYQGRAAVILSLAFLIIAPTAMAAQDALEEATQAYMNEAKTLWTAQQEFRTAWTAWHAESGATDESAPKDKARELLKKTTGTLQYRNDILKAWLATRPVDAAGKGALTAQIDGNQSRLHAGADGLERASLQGLRAGARGLVDDLTAQNSLAERATAEGLLGRLDALIVTADETGDSLRAAMEDSPASGEDTAQIGVWLSDYEDLIEEARSSRDTAAQTFATAAGTNGSSGWRDGLQSISDAHRSIARARDVFRDIVAEIEAN